MKTHKMLLCSHYPNDVPPPLPPPSPEPQRNVSIAAVRGAVRPSKTHKIDSVGSSGNLERYPWQPHLEVKTIYYPPFSVVFYT